MCLLNIVVNPMLNTLGGGGNKGNQLIQFGGSCNSIGGTLAPILLGYLIGGNVEAASVADAAPAMMIAMGIFLLAFVIIFFTNIPEPHMETAEEKAARLAGNQLKDAHSPLSFRHFVLGAVAIFFYVGVEVGIPNMANLYMSGNPAVGAAIAGTVVGLYWLMMMFGRLIGGAIGGKVSSKVMLATVSLLGVCLLLGDREKNSKEKRMAMVEERTTLAADILKTQCHGKVTFELVEGTHFSPILPRIERAVEKTMEK